ncbi:hypothetical protein DSM104299_04164 [Baekduia alba]|nr:hypothetical protein DSM104299_04164 [Baekduia alba]
MDDVTNGLPAEVEHVLRDAIRAVLPRDGGNPAAAAISFPGGDYVVPTGGLAEDVHVVRHLLMAFFLFKEPPPEALRVEALTLALVVLRLAAHVSSVVGLDRRGDAASRVFEEIAAGLVMTAEELDAVVAPHGDALQPLVTETLPPVSWAATPLYQYDDLYVLVGADQLLVTLRHQLLMLAARAGWLDVLSDRVMQAHGTSIERSLERLEWTHAGLVADDDLTHVRHEVWRFDDDAAAIVTTLADDLLDYDGQEPDTPWHAAVHVDRIARRGAALAQQLLAGPRSPNHVLHLVVLAGVGRSAAWFDQADHSVTGLRRVSLFAGDLEIVSVAERNDPLALWRYVQDSDRLECRIMTTDPLEAFALWRSESHSFYLGDDRPPTLITSQGRAEALRADVLRRVDRHGVPGPPGRGLIEVAHRFDEIDAPLYRPITADIDGIAVDVDGMHVWVLAHDLDRLIGQLVDAVAYWVWQLAGDLTCGRLAITVALGGDGTISVEEVGRGWLQLSLDPRENPAFARPDNEGERQLVRVLLSALADSDDDLDVDEVVERMAPLGFKKMVLMFGPRADLSLDSQKLPRKRLPLRESDDAEAMDELGAYLRRSWNRAVGLIATEDRTVVLWKAVRFHLGQLTALISTLHPDGVLEALIVANESLMSQGAFDRYILPTRLACYGDTTDIVGHTQREYARHADASVALRFVIECVAAFPPRGLRPMTLAVQDRLVALAAQVVGRGGVSDAIREGLDDTQLSMLASGRLGIARDGRFYAGRARFMDRFRQAQVDRAHRHFPSMWNEDDAGDEALAEVAKLDAAAVHEWGMSLTEILQLFQDLVDMSDRDPVTVIGVDEVVHRLVAEFDWEERKLRAAIGHFSLGPRDSLLTPSDPFSGADVYPWRFGRRLSLLRRPLVLRPGSDGEELVYGFRAVHAAGRMLVDDISHARLKVTTPEMTRAIGALRQKEDAQFNSRVAKLYASVPGFVVREQVDRVAGKHIARSSDQPLGDIDVLALDPHERVIHAVEVKNLAVSRTPIEIARELKRTFKSDGSKPAAIDRHVERVAWLEAHRADVVAWLGQDWSDAWTVRGSIVVDAEVTAPFLEDLPMPVLDFWQLADALAERS